MMRGFYFSLQVQEKKKLLLSSLSFTQFLHLLSLEARNKMGWEPWPGLFPFSPFLPCLSLSLSHSSIDTYEYRASVSQFVLSLLRENESRTWTVGSERGEKGERMEEKRVRGGTFPSGKKSSSFVIYPLVPFRCPVCSVFRNRTPFVPPLIKTGVIQSHKSLIFSLPLSLSLSAFVLHS